MHSIRTRITSYTIAAIVICAFLIGSVSVFTVKQREEQNSEEIMHVMCESKCDKINYYLTSLEDSVDTISRIIYDSMDAVVLTKSGVCGATGSGISLEKRERSPEQINNLNQYLASHVSDVDEVFKTIANNNTSVLGYYYYINPEFDVDTKGFWYSRTGSSRFRKMRLTDIAKYPADDFNHVGWYYLPLERGRPSWIEPYENQNFNATIVSYTMPLYKAGTFLGIIGMDIDYSTLIDQIRDLAVLDKGYAFLTDDKGKILYHPSVKNGMLLSDVNRELDAAEKDDNEKSLARYSYNGIEKRAAWKTLSNGMRLIIAAPASEINAGWQSLTELILIISVVITMAVLIVFMLMMKKITDPMEQLAKASEEVTAGKYDIRLEYEGDDELASMTRAFNTMTRHLQVFIKDLNSKAYKDALTSVRNKAAFNIFNYNMDDEINLAKPGHEPQFGIAMFDCNELKWINDTFGHEKGDIYLRTACRLICKIYDHSPVFRIGGDEFTVILQNDDLKNHEALEKKFNEEVRIINETAANPWEMINIASGMAIYDPIIDKDMESVMRRADKRMYDNKNTYKESNHPEVYD